MCSPSPAVTPRLSVEEEARSRTFCRWKLWLDLAEVLALVGVLCWLTLSGASRSLLGWTRSLAVREPVDVLLYLIILGSGVRLSLLPVRFASGYWLEGRFGLMRQTALSWLWEWTCGSCVLGCLTLALLYPIALTLPWWPYLLLPWVAAYLALRRAYVDWLYFPLLRLFYPVRLLRYETFSLPGVGRTTLPIYEVGIAHRTARVGASIHLRGKRSAIYVTDTLIAEFTDDEERVVMAHEFGHLWDQLHLERRTPAGVRQAARKAILGFAQLASVAASFLLLEIASPRLHLAGAADLSGLPLLAALALGLARVWSPLTCAEARHDEADADRFALGATGDVPSYLAVLTKLRRINLDEFGASPLSRLLFDTHPTYEERAHLAWDFRPLAPRRARRGPHRHRGDRHRQR